MMTLHFLGGMLHIFWWCEPIKWGMFHWVSWQTV